MIDISLLQKYRQRVEDELTQNILPFWIKHTIDSENGGFYGEVSANLTPKKDEPKGIVLSSRILWTYARAYRLYKKDEYLQMADRAFDYLIKYFWDKEHIGFYWILDYKGNPIITRKVLYGQAFAIYGLSEYYRATGNSDSLKYAQELVSIIHEKSYDKENGGYFENFTRDWKLMRNFQLEERPNVTIFWDKSLNTHLHIMEAFSNLLQGWNDSELRAKLQELVNVIVHKTYNASNLHCNQIFDDKWNVLKDIVSYGHDIETSWLLVDTYRVLNGNELDGNIRDIAIKLARSSYEEGQDEDGGLYYEIITDKGSNLNKYWWPQAEAVVGFLNAYQMTGDERFFEAFRKCWDFIEQHISDRKGGEWFQMVSKNRERPIDEPKVDMWKCPYHNARACYEVIRMLKELEKAKK